MLAQTIRQQGSCWEPVQIYTQIMRENTDCESELDISIGGHLIALVDLIRDVAHVMSVR